jgi:hypothetical protein
VEANLLAVFFQRGREIIAVAGCGNIDKRRERLFQGDFTVVGSTASVLAMFL